VTELTKADIVLDFSGEVCPIPLLKTRKALDKMKEGKVLEVIGTDEKAKIDITPRRLRSWECNSKKWRRTKTENGIYL
jgi:TusA-related sulfurtransferase